MQETSIGGGKPHTLEEISSGPADRTWNTPKLRRIPVGDSAGKSPNPGEAVYTPTTGPTS